MKNSIKMIIITMMISIQANRLVAQNTNANAGIYLTVQDYKAGRLSYVPEAGEKLKLHEFLGGNHISVNAGSKKISLLRAMFLATATEVKITGFIKMKHMRYLIQPVFRFIHMHK